MTILIIACLILVFTTLGFFGAPLWAWTLIGFGVLFVLEAPVWVWIVYAIPMLVFNLPFLRRALVTSRLVAFMKAKHFLPTISETEQTAIEAGNIWVDGDLFSGKPNLRRLIHQPLSELTEEERAFRDGPTEELCQMTNDWEVYQQRELPPQVWDYMKKQKFFGMIIPKKYGGLGFSASAHSAVVMKIMSRCAPLGITVMVPNSLGPAELILHYGTEKQKDYYLPRLARGEEIPCFALTEPEAGSDAGSMKSFGVVFKGTDGKLYIRLNWNKRYITLAAISTILGLAFKLRDPDNLLGKGENPGITCALIPTDTKGVKLGRRHDPMGVPFYNSPTEGKDVVVPVDAIIGGAEQAGNGWRMLVESLAVGRGISLPATATGNAKFITRVIGAYVKVRSQFGLSIGRFEGIEEVMAPIGGFTYLMEAARRYTCSGLDSGQKPAVINAMAKYNFTELGRKIVNDGMDIVGGAGISRGPRNLLSNIYMNIPISITVEGANILTRTLMIFGQGAIRCHPYALQEIKALMENDLTEFDKAFWRHMGHVVRNLCRSVILSVTRGYLALTPVSGATARYYRKLAWASASFALMADLTMALYGGTLKRKEKLTGRFSDIFSWMYLGLTALRRFEADGRKKEDLPLVHWSLQHAFNRIQTAFDEIFLNMPGPFFSLIGFWSRLNPIGSAPSDRIGHQVAQIMQTLGAQRDALTDNIFIPEDPEEALGRLERAFRLVTESEEVLKKITDAVKSGQLQKDALVKLAEKAVAAGVITKAEAQLLAKAEEARNDAIQVDSFTLSEYKGAAAEAKRAAA